MSMTPEGRVKHAVKKYISKLGMWFYMPVQNGMGRTGIPDIIGCRPITITQEMVGSIVGVFVAIETKAPGKAGNTTPNQDRELDGIRAAGGVGLVVDNVTTVEDLLK